MKRVLLSPLSMLLGALITMLTLVLALSMDEAAVIAAYSVGVSVGSIVAVVSGGGSTLAFITGDVDTQRSARTLRIKVVAPAILVATAATAWIYGASTGLSVPAIVLGGATVLVNTANELDTAYLNRKLATVSIMFFDVSSRLIGVAVLLLIGSFAFAMFSASLCRLAFLIFASRSDPSRHGAFMIPIPRAWRRAAQPSLIGVSLAYALIDRLLFFIVPFATSAVIAGYFASMLSAQQAVSGAVSSGLRTLMAARSEHRLRATGGDMSWGRRVELVLTLLSFVGAVIGIVFASFFLKVLSIPDSPLLIAMWVLVVAAMPFGVLSRAIQYRLIESGASRRALVLLVVVAAAQVMVSLAAMWQSDLLLLMAALALGEFAGLVWAAAGAAGTVLRRRRDN